MVDPRDNMESEAVYVVSRHWTFYGAMESSMIGAFCSLASAEEMVSRQLPLIDGKQYQYSIELLELKP